jgi:hypothetical protein
LNIRRLSDTARLSGTPPRQAPLPPAAPQPGGGEAARDRYDGRPPSAEAADTPFWLVAMSSDRLARRQYLSESQRKAAAKLEATWLRQIAAAALPGVVAWAAALPAAPTLADWQVLSGHLAEHAGGFPAPRAVWQPGLKAGRGQLLFRVEGSLLQLRPGAPGTRAEWVATVAHETFHHVQQCLVTALYRGEPGLPAPLDQLAAYYRDARNAYDTLGPHCPPDRHRRQPLEVGAWAYGEAIAGAITKNG